MKRIIVIGIMALAIGFGYSVMTRAADTAGPTVSNALVSPSVVTAGTQVIVTADISDPSGVNTVRVAVFERPGGEPKWQSEYISAGGVVTYRLSQAINTTGYTEGTYPIIIFTFDNLFTWATHPNNFTTAEIGRLIVDLTELVVETSGLSINLNLKQGHIGKSFTGKNIYLSGEDVVIAVEVTNKGNQERNISFEYQIVDFFGKTVEQNSKNYKVDPTSSSQTEIIYRPQKNGVFYVKYWIKDKGLNIEEGKASFSVIPAESKSKGESINSLFGICFGIPDMMDITGLKWCRHDFTWDIIEPEKGKFDWSWSDKIVNDAVRYGYNLMPILDYSATWASTAPEDIPKKERWHYPPRLKDWEDYVKAVVNRYKDKIKYWEIWNEPNSPVFFTGGDAQQYAELIKTAYLAAKEVDQDCKIIGGVCISSDLLFLEKVFKVEGIKYMDIISVHPYRPSFGNPEETNFLGEMESLRQLIDNYGGTNKPIWLTEFDWPADDLDASSKDFVNKGLIVTEIEQANYLARMYIQSLSTGYVKNLFWFPMRHPVATLVESTDCGAGLLRHDYTAKPALLAHRTLTDLLTDTVPIRSKDLGSLKMYTFRKRNGEEITAIWNIDGPQIAALNIGDNEFYLINLMNNKEEMIIEKKPYLLIVDTTPLFLKGKNIQLIGGIMEIDSGEDNTLTDKKNIKVLISNLTDEQLAGNVLMTSADFESEPKEVSFSLQKGEISRNEFKASIKDNKTERKKRLNFTLNLKKPLSLNITQEKKLIVTSSYNELVFKESFEEDISEWLTNATDKHVEYNTIEKSTKYVQDGKYSLKWRCKSSLWNNIFRNFPDGIDQNAKEIEIWVYLEKSTVGSHVIGPVIIEKGGAQYGYWDKLKLPTPGKWQKYTVPIKDLVPGVGVETNPDHKVTLNEPFGLYINYTGGELEAYVDNIRILK